MSRQRLGMHGFGEHPWRSVDRTRQFYLRSLEPEFELLFQDGPFTPGSVDAVLSFVGNTAWNDVATATVPYLFAIHGGATLDHAALRGCAGRLRSADTLIVNCTSDETILRKMFAGRAPRFCQLPLPAHEACFEAMDREEARAQVPFAEPPDLVLGFVARLLPQKNLHRFLGMLAEVSAALAPRRVDGIVIGEYWGDYPVLPYVTHDYRDYVAALTTHLGIRDRVVYLGGGLDDEQLRCVYGALDVLVHPTASLDENFGYVPVEAMACGVPVVGAAYGGLKDTVVDGKTGFLMPTWTTSSGLRMDLIGGVEQLTRLLRDDVLRQRLSQGAREHALTSYNHARCAARLVSAVREAIALHPRAVPLRAAPPLPLPSAAGYLPALEVGWEYYWPVVDDYVQGRAPHLADDTRLRVAASPQFESGSILLGDPAWPARIPLGSEELEVCRACATTQRRAALDSTDACIAALLSKGALIASNPRSFGAEP